MKIKNLKGNEKLRLVPKNSIYNWVCTKFFLFLLSMSYVVAIPSYNRADSIVDKTLSYLLKGGVSSSKISIFVANKSQEKMYKSAIPETMYSEIVVGKLGIANQRKFISKWFDEGQYIISIDDDVEELQILSKSGEKLNKIT